MHCPVCLASSVVETDIAFVDIIGAQPYLSICATCDHWFVSPMPGESELEKFYRTRLKMNSKAYLKSYSGKKLQIFKKIIDKLKLPGGCSVLEIGPGPIGIASIIPRNSSYVSIEPGLSNSSELLKVARLNNVNIKSLENMHELSGLNIKFDLIFSNATLEHMISPRDALVQVLSYARPGAHIIIGVPSRQLEFPDEALVRSGFFSKINYCNTHLHSFSVKSMTTLLDECNIAIDARLSTLAEGRMIGYALVHRSWYSLAENRRNAISLRWSILYFLRLVYHRIIGNKIIDPTPPGDDRGETIYVGRFIGPRHN